MSRQFKNEEGTIFALDSGDLATVIESLRLQHNQNFADPSSEDGALLPDAPGFDEMVAIQMLCRSSSPLVEIGLEELLEATAPTPEELQAEANGKARAYLASTDWYVMRQLETGKEIPAEILAKRQAARDSVK